MKSTVAPNLPPQFASWSLQSPQTLDATSKRHNGSIPVCLKQDSKFAFPLLEENTPQSPNPREVDGLLSLATFPVQFGSGSAPSWEGRYR